MSGKPTIFDFEVHSTADRQIRVLRDILKQFIPTSHEAQTQLDRLLPKEFLTPSEAVLAVWFELKLPEKSQLDLEAQNQQYLANVQDQYNQAKALSHERGYTIAEPSVLTQARTLKTLIVSDDAGTLMFSFQQNKHVQIQYNKEITKSLFAQILASSESTNLYCLTIQVLRRCEQLGLSSEQVKKALIILCQEKVPSFKATLTNLMTQGVRTMLTHFLSQTSQTREEGLIYDKLKALKRTGGVPSMMTLITQLRICYLDFFNIKNPSENSMKSNLERAESLAYQNSLDFLTPVAVLRVKRNISEYTERNGLGPDRDTLINFLEAVEEVDTSSRTLEPITLRSSSIYLGQMNAKLIGDMEARDSERVFQDSRLNEIHLNFLSKGKTKSYVNKVDNAKNQYNNFDKNKKKRSSQ